MSFKKKSCFNLQNRRGKPDTVETTHRMQSKCIKCYVKQHSELTRKHYINSQPPKVFMERPIIDTIVELRHEEMNDLDYVTPDE